MNTAVNEKQNIETQALLRRADMAIKNNGKMPKGLARQIGENENFTEKLNNILEDAAEAIGEEEITRIANLSDEELDAEIEKGFQELLNDPAMAEVIPPDVFTYGFTHH